MSPNDLRLRHLSRSSELLGVSSPSTAAILNMQKASLQRNRTSDQDPEVGSRCLACGSSQLKLRTIWTNQIKSRRKQDPVAVLAKTPEATRMLTRTCTRCKRISKHTITGPPRPLKTLVAATQPAVVQVQSNKIGEAVSDQGLTKAAATNASSKKRAKARKEGLQALLDKSKQDVKPAASFSLMDFMRKS